jgi:uncharacterized BrkB/YihY/UPF0761 family membrane protein
VLLLLFGLVMLAWFTLGAIRALVLAYALAWHVTPGGIRRPLHAIGLFNAVFVLAVLASAGVTWVREQLGLPFVLGSLVTAGCLIALAMYAMWLLPHAAARRRDLLPGAVLIAIGNQAISILALVYFAPRLGRAEETYGALGTAATLLVWLYLVSRLVTGAAFLNATLQRRRAAR